MKKNIKSYFICLILTLVLIPLLFSCVDKEDDDNTTPNIDTNTVYKIEFDLGNAYFNEKYKDSIQPISVDKNTKIKAMPVLKFLENDVAKYKIDNWEYNGQKFLESTYITSDMKLTAKYSVQEVYLGEYPFSRVNPDEIEFLGEEYKRTYNDLKVNNVAIAPIEYKYIDDVNGNKYEIRDGKYYRFEKIVWELISIDSSTATHIAINDVKEGQYFVAKEILDTCDYYSTVDNSSITHEKYYKFSRLREFLNKVFYDRAFTDTEKTFIEQRALYHRQITGNTINDDLEITKDYVFIPALADVKQNSNFNIKRNKNSQYLKDFNNTNYFWTRSPSDRASNVAKLYIYTYDMLNRKSIRKPSDDKNGIVPIIFIDESYYK